MRTGGTTMPVSVAICFRMARTRLSSVPPCFSSTIPTSAYPTSTLRGSTPIVGSGASDAAGGASAVSAESVGCVRTL